MSSCSSEFQKALKSGDYNAKYQMAIKYFDQKDYARAQQLFESIVGVYKGTDKDESINYYIAQCYYNNNDFIMSSFYFKNFTTTFPNSEKLEESKYLTAYSYYKCSPKYSLDQDYTNNGISEFQSYLNRYPKGVYAADASKYLSELRKKIEKKAFLSTKLYFDMEQYKAASIAFKNFLSSYPDSDFREESLFLLVKSEYLMASNSISEKQVERYESVISDYESYIDEYPSGKYTKDAEKYYSKSQDFIKSKAH